MRHRFSEPHRNLTDRADMTPRAGVIDDHLCQRIDTSLSAALGWISDHFGSFSPFDEHDTYSSTRMKPFIELALLFGIYAAAGRDTGIPLAGRVANLLREVIHRPDFMDWVIRRPEEIVNYAELCAAVQELGGDSRAIRARLQSAVDLGVLAQIERLPHRQVEIRATLDWAGVNHSLPPVADLCAQTILSQPIFAPLLSDHAIYAITHVIFFASRFGVFRSSMPAWLSSGKVSTLLSDLIVVSAQERNWDILGELLLSWDSLGLPDTGITAAGWETFLEAQRPDGAFPASSKMEGRKIIVDAGGILKFDDLYHTTLVSVFAGIVHLKELQSRHEPPKMAMFSEASLVVVPPAVPNR